MMVKNINKVLNGISILDNISFILYDCDKIGLVGDNGAGKSTLLKVISGDLQLDSGKISLNGEIARLLKQEISFEDYEYTILDYLKKETKVYDLEQRLLYLQNNLNDKNMDEYGKILEHFLQIDGYNFDNNVKYILSGLKFETDLNSQIKILSGGEKIKILLASLLLSNPDILLLDEPTNNLDIEAITWLEDYLVHLKKKMIIISHDEDFLNTITNKIFEIKNGQINEYNFSYTEFLEYQELKYQQELDQYNDSIEKKNRLKKAVKEANEWANKGLSSKTKKDNDKIASGYAKERTKKTSSKISKLNKELEEMDNLYFKKKESINFDINFSNENGNKDIIICNLICGYETFKTPEINLKIPFRTRIQLTGKNGSGKITLIKTLLNEVKPISGQIIIGNEIKFSYISQNTMDLSDTSCTIYEFLTKDLDKIDNGMLFTILDKFNIPYEDKNKKYNILSPGERTRINLAKLSINKVNVLILDEVTNHLDLEATKLIYEVIENFKGTIISISHNRKFYKILNPDMSLNIVDGTIEYKVGIQEKKVKLKL